MHAYEQWGIAGLARLNGMYALAVWDSTRRVLVIARDPFGVKPLYHWDDGTTLLFGSEIRAILCSPSVRREVDHAALEEFVAQTYVAAPRTAFAGIGKLLPGHALVYDEAGKRVERFHTMIPKPRVDASEAELVAELESSIEDAIRRQMVSDVPVGAMLSGGIDSAMVAAVMTEYVDGPIDTFTVGFGSDLAIRRASVVYWFGCVLLPGLILELFKLEVPEIADGIVELKACAREPGHRTKIAVWSNDSNVDPVGACVGARGARVRQVVNELNGEKIDIVPFSDDPYDFVMKALSPAKVKEVRIDVETGTATVIVPDFQLSLAIGKEGQNARLAARLTGWRVDIKSETQLADEEAYQGEEWAQGEWVVDPESGEQVWVPAEGGPALSAEEWAHAGDDEPEAKPDAASSRARGRSRAEAEARSPRSRSSPWRSPRQSREYAAQPPGEQRAMTPGWPKAGAPRRGAQQNRQAKQRER